MFVHLRPDIKQKYKAVATLPAACKEYPAPSIVKTGDYKLHYQNQRRKHARPL